MNAKRYLFRGEFRTRREVEEITGWSESAVRNRIRGNIIEDRPLYGHGSSLRRLEYGGRNLTFREWSAITGLSIGTLQHRIRRGWTVAEAIATPKRQGRPLHPRQRRRKVTRQERTQIIAIEPYKGRPLLNTRALSREGRLHVRTIKPAGKREPIAFNGKEQTLPEWAKETGIPYNTLRDRLRQNGWSIERALTEPLNKTRRAQPDQSAPPPDAHPDTGGEVQKSEEPLGTGAGRHEKLFDYRCKQ